MKKGWTEIIKKIVLWSFIIPMVYIIYKIVVAPSANIEHIEGLRIKTDYILMLSQCILALIAMLLPSILSKKLKIVIPSNMYLVYILFLYASAFLGEVRSFYYRVPHWDVILHACSGAMLGALGFSFINILNNYQKLYFKLSPIFVCVFAFCFSITLGVIWEIYEFTFDGILSLNMQKFALESGILLEGREAIIDTMKDLIVDCLGALVMSILGFISLKYKKGWIEKLLIKKGEKR